MEPLIVMICREGYWKSGPDSQLPLPVAGDEPWVGMAEFLRKLARLEAKARAKAVRPLMCRLCKLQAGNIEYEFGGWTWMGSLQHYVNSHNLRPSLAFQEFVLERTIK